MGRAEDALQRLVLCLSNTLKVGVKVAEETGEWKILGQRTVKEGKESV